VLDLDRPSLNDTHSHLTGMAVRTVSPFSDHLPADAVAYRYGGDEFVVALPRIGSRYSRDRRRALSRCPRKRPTWPASGSPGRSRSRGCSAELGQVEFPDPRTDERAGESLFRAADAARYAAKSEDGIRSAAPAPASHVIAAG
jgi:GGDEF domain-containing protein